MFNVMEDAAQGNNRDKWQKLRDDWSNHLGVSAGVKNIESKMIGKDRPVASCI